MSVEDADILEKCPYCGLRTENPCDEPPPCYCERALEAMYERQKT